MATTTSGDVGTGVSSTFFFEGVAGVLPPEPGVLRGVNLGEVMVFVEVAGFVGWATAGERARDSEAAVGLLRRSKELLFTTFLGGVGAGDGAPRARARDAAVGA